MTDPVFTDRAALDAWVDAKTLHPAHTMGELLRNLFEIDAVMSAHAHLLEETPA